MFSITEIKQRSGLKVFVTKLKINSISVCRNISYRNTVLEMFPNIKVLDGKIF